MAYSPPWLCRRTDRVCRSLGAVQAFGRLGPVEPEVKEKLQVILGRRRRRNDKAHRPSFGRLASSLDCSRCRTVSTGTETPVRWHAPDAACARAWNETWTRLTALAFGTVAEHTGRRFWGFVGEPRVNVLHLNLALDAAQRRCPLMPADAC